MRLFYFFCFWKLCLHGLERLTDSANDLIWMLDLWCAAEAMASMCE